MFFCSIRRLCCCVVYHFDHFSSLYITLGKFYASFLDLNLFVVVLYHNMIVLFWSFLHFLVVVLCHFDCLHRFVAILCLLHHFMVILCHILVLLHLLIVIISYYYYYSASFK